MSIALESAILASDDGGMLVLAVVALLFGGLFLLFPFIMTGALIWSDRRSGRKVQRNPACSRCGYNLTGNTSGVCPECGRVCAVMPLPPSNIQAPEPPRGWLERLPDSLYSIVIASLLLAVCAVASVVVIVLISLAGQ